HGRRRRSLPLGRRRSRRAAGSSPRDGAPPPPARAGCGSLRRAPFRRGPTILLRAIAPGLRAILREGRRRAEPIRRAPRATLAPPWEKLERLARPLAKAAREQRRPRLVEGARRRAARLGRHARVLVGDRDPRVALGAPFGLR